MKTAEEYLCDHYCIFCVGDTEYAVSAASVREVADRLPVIRVPRSAPILEGLCHHRNEFVAVLSLPSLLGESAQDVVDCPYLLILEGSDGPWAIPISRAIGLEPLEIASSGETAWDGQRPLVMGTASFRDGVVRILDSDRIYRAASDVLCDTWTGPDLRQRSSQHSDYSLSTLPAEAGR